MKKATDFSVRGLEFGFVTYEGTLLSTDEVTAA
jgi:hypothetical protein